MLLAETLPVLADQLAALVRQKGTPELAGAASRIVVGAGMSFAPRLYNTQSQPEDQYGAGHDCADLDAAEGMMYMDTVAEEIVHVEILNRQDIRHPTQAS